MEPQALMSVAIPDILAQLADDHTSFRRALNALDRQIAGLVQCSDSDRTALEKSVKYFRDQPEDFHHPTEVLIASVLRERHPRVRDVFMDLDSQHRALARKLKEFARAIAAASAGGPPELEKLRDAGCAFIASKRQHIREEETSLFGLALTVLEPEEWREIEHRARRVPATTQPTGSCCQ